MVRYSVEKAASVQRITLEELQKVLRKSNVYWHYKKPPFGVNPPTQYQIAS